MYSLTQLCQEIIIKRYFTSYFNSYMFRLVSVEPSSGWAF